MSDPKTTADLARALDPILYPHLNPLTQGWQRLMQITLQVRTVFEAAGWVSPEAARQAKADLENAREAGKVYRQRAEKAEAEVRDLKARAILDLSALQEAAERAHAAEQSLGEADAEIERLKATIIRVRDLGKWWADEGQSNYDPLYYSPYFGEQVLKAVNGETHDAEHGRLADG